MQVYKFTNLDKNDDNGDILLEKVILNLTNYTVINEDNGNIILKKACVNINNIDDIKQYDFAKSDILHCLLNNDNTLKLKYKSILENTYKIIDDGTKIIKNSKLNIKTFQKNDDGFNFLKDIGISYQGVDSNKCLFEIINQCVKNNISLNLKIKLNNQTIINMNF